MNAFSLKNSIGLRIVIIGFLSLVLLIPVLMIQSVIKERQGRFTETQNEISSKWGGTQNITGPLLVIPRIRRITSAAGEKHIFNENIYILPDELKMSGEVIPQVRYRGIYKTVVYTSDIDFSGAFDTHNLKDFENESDILLDDAYLVLGISDLKGINHALDITWQKQKIQALPGIKDNGPLLSGITFKIPVNDDNNKYNFQFNLNLNGSTDLFFTPVGKVTMLELSSDWPDPIFTGSFLPENRDVSDQGFSASWKILNYNRNYPQQWVGNAYKLNDSDFGVSFKFLVDIYQKTERTTKYAIMFIALTFLTFFMFEILGKKLLHPVQYVLIGFALLVFYTLLLALSEYIGFDWSYLVAAIAIISLITSYSKSILQSRYGVLTVSGILIFLYFYLYIILQLQDFSLLIGSIGLFIILALVMYLTRKVDWFNVKKETM